MRLPLQMLLHASRMRLTPRPDLAALTNCVQSVSRYPRATLDVGTQLFNGAATCIKRSAKVSATLPHWNEHQFGARSEECIVTSGYVGGHSPRCNASLGEFLMARMHLGWDQRMGSARASMTSTAAETVSPITARQDPQCIGLGYGSIRLTGYRDAVGFVQVLA